MTFWQRSHEGYLMVDHRASPGIRCDMPAMGEGKMFEAPTLGCPHCAAVVVMNPKRTRERGYCSKCNRYICDHCTAVMRKSGYLHRTFLEVADMVRSGKYQITGGTSVEPVLTQTGIQHG